MSRRSGESSGSRRNTDPSRSSDFEYRTSRGSLAARVVASQVDSAPDPRDSTRRSRYPREYRNEEGRPPNTHRPFADHERRANERLYEVPVSPPEASSRFDFDRRAASRQQVERSSASNVHPNDRGRVVRQPPNDPGPHRAVMAADPNDRDRRARGPIGVITHPTTNPTGYERAQLAPISSSARRHEQQYYDQQTSGHSSWPPRAMYSEDLERMERGGRRRGGEGGGRRRHD
ncbi:hypothetical protein VTI28DRAFT_308 [Corynascus sepedonium]